MTPFPSSVQRALNGLPEGSGRTLVITGPPTAGKSALLNEIRGQLGVLGAEVRSVQGTYRERMTPLAALQSLESVPLGPELPGAAAPVAPLPEEAAEYVPMAPLDFAGPEPPRARRSGRGTSSVTAALLGQSARRRSASSLEVGEYYQSLRDRFRAANASPVALLVEDGTLVDAESREFLLFLSERARWRPILIVFVLDTSLPAYTAWEERLVGRGDVDWVRLPRTKQDPREVHRLKENFDAIPDSTRRVLVFTALMGGAVSEVSLGRATRMNWRSLAEALVPATEANLVKIGDGKVSIAHQAWVSILPELIPDALRRETHREIADALAALNPEPDLKRRMELAQHYYDWSPGSMALRYLLETAEISERLFAFDSAEELIAKALTCLPSLPPNDRHEAEAELRLFHARTLVFAGRVAEGEREFFEGVSVALRHSTSPDRLEEWVELAVPALRVAGPRPTMVSMLMELSDRCHDSAAISAEVLLQSVVAEFEHERGRHDRARVEANRGAQQARSLPPGPAQALALLSVGTALADGEPEERALAGKFLASARSMLQSARRYGLEQHAEEVRLRLIELRRNSVDARRGHERALPIVQRMGALTTELYHRLDLAGIDLDTSSHGARVAAELKRAREITELLHLLPPAPGLAREWLLEGRMAAAEGRLDEARDRWDALADREGPSSLPVVRAEALLRLALLELQEGDRARAQQYVGRLTGPEDVVQPRPEWVVEIEELERRAAASRHGSGPLPLAASYPNTEAKIDGSIA